VSLKQQYRDIYKWRLHFPDGRVINQGEPGEWTGAHKIELLPYVGGYNPVSINIPEGATPIFNFSCIEELGGAFLNMIFNIGYSTPQGKLLLHVDCFHKAMSAEWIN